MHCERLTRRTVNLTCVNEQALKKILLLSEQRFDAFHHVETQVQTVIDLVNHSYPLLHLLQCRLFCTVYDS